MLAAFVFPSRHFGFPVSFSIRAILGVLVAILALLRWRDLLLSVIYKQISFPHFE
jgi:hypothetical protein